MNEELEAANKRIAELEAMCKAEALQRAFQQRITELEDKLHFKNGQAYSISIETEKQFKELNELLNKSEGERERWRVAYAEAYQRIPSEDEMILKKQHYEELLAGLPHVVPDGKKPISPSQIDQLRTFSAVLRRQDQSSELANTINAVLNHLGF